jgi:Uma2 family endonuclease
LGSWFFLREREWNIRAVTDQRFQVSPARFRVPDVTVIDCTQPVEQILTHPPLIVIEVFSPEDTWRRIEQRVADYLKFGIPNIWILDLAPRRAWIATRAGFAETHILQVEDSPITVSLDELFRELE